VKIVEEFNDFLFDYDMGFDEVDIRVEELTVFKSSGELRGEIYINIAGIEYSGWFFYNLINRKFSIENTLIEALVQETYAHISESSFIDFFKTNLVSISL